MSKHSDITTYSTANGFPRYQIEIWHDELNKYQVIRGDNIYIVEQKALAKMHQWDDMWGKRETIEKNRLDKQKKVAEVEEKKKTALEQTEEAELELKLLTQILSHTLTIDDTVNWDSLKNFSDFPEAKPQEPTPPDKPILPEISKEPQETDSEYAPKFNIFDRLIKSRKELKIQEMNSKFLSEHKDWEENKTKSIEKHEADFMNWENKARDLALSYKNEINEWDIKKNKYIEKRDLDNASIDTKREKYLKGDPEAVLDYCDLVLSNSDYPDYFPQTFDLDYNPINKMLIVDYQLPPLTKIPSLKEVKYIQSRDEFDEKHISRTELNRIYDEILYQITLRSIHELFEADKANSLSIIVFNGFVKSIDPSIGKETNSCVLSVQTNKDEFLEINLENVDPKACFKKLKGVGSSKLHSITPIAPIVVMNKEDKRFIDSYDVTNKIEEGENIAAMDWEDFEHLVRELFEKEFAKGGGEVKVTRASRDGGIDAVVFDPDPLRGGKIVIQAKRYTNTVGVSAVRDLFGSVMNEGANKGILVSTADYGPDAYDFAKGKPLVLLNGGNLLHLLAKHGHKAKIDLKEAKQILAEKEDDKRLEL